MTNDEAGRLAAKWLGSKHEDTGWTPGDLLLLQLLEQGERLQALLVLIEAHLSAWRS